MLVLDTSALLAALVGSPTNAALNERLSADGDLHAPHLIDAEALHALRKLVRQGDLSLERALSTRQDLRDLTIVRYPHVAWSIECGSCARTSRPTTRPSWR